MIVIVVPQMKSVHRLIVMAIAPIPNHWLMLIIDELNNRIHDTFHTPIKRLNDVSDALSVPPVITVGEAPIVKISSHILL